MGLGVGVGQSTLERARVKPARLARLTFGLETVFASRAEAAEKEDGSVAPESILPYACEPAHGPGGTAASA